MDHHPPPPRGRDRGDDRWEMEFKNVLNLSTNCAEWQLVLLIHNIQGFHGGENIPSSCVMTLCGLVEGYWLFERKWHDSPAPLQLQTTKGQHSVVA